ncbi:hypothetical protein [Streptomyces sp. NBC_01334]|uniref:hypothetical protein n=1 Tax=Streptomyces sp. NBC_01334 TaxID=2903827 RepID=UPI002E1522DC
MAVTAPSGRSRVAWDAEWPCAACFVCGGLGDESVVEAAAVGGSAEEGVERIAFAPEDKTGRGHRSPGKLHEPGQNRGLGRQFGRVEAERPGSAVASAVEVWQVLPVLVGGRPEFFGRPSGNVPPPRRHETHRQERPARAPRDRLRDGLPASLTLCQPASQPRRRVIIPSAQEQL